MRMGGGARVALQHSSSPSGKPEPERAGWGSGVDKNLLRKKLSQLRDLGPKRPHNPPHAALAYTRLVVKHWRLVYTAHTPLLTDCTQNSGTGVCARRRRTAPYVRSLAPPTP